MTMRLLVTWGIVSALTGCFSLRPYTESLTRTIPNVKDVATVIPAAHAEVSRPSSSTTAKAEPELPAVDAARACLKTAEELHSRGFETDAIKEYEHARRLDPTLTMIAAKLATLYARNGDDSRAIAEFEKAIAAQPNDPATLNDLGCFQSDREDWSAAEKSFHRALRQKPDHARSCVNLAVVYAKSGRVEESRIFFRRVLTPAQAEYNLGVIFAGLGRTAEAETSFKAALDLDPQLDQARDALDKLQNKRPARSGTLGFNPTPSRW